MNGHLTLSSDFGVEKVGVYVLEDCYKNHPTRGMGASITITAMEE